MKLDTKLPLVVLTYPGHFLLTVLTIRSYLEYHNPTEIIVIADDLSPYAWDTYLTDCQHIYRAPVIPFSSIEATKQFNNGWIRQQIAKLHLDQAVETDDWFFTDGDIVFLNPVKPEHTPYSVPQYDVITQKQNEYVQKLLGITPGIKVQDKQVCVSNPPFRTMYADVLRQLRNRLGNSINLTGVGMSEWELIENFRQHILGQTLHLIKYAPHKLKDSNAELNYFDCQFLTCYGTDKDLGRDFFDFPISDRIWQILSQINR